MKGKLMSEKTQPILVIEDPTTTRLDRLKKSLRKPTRIEVGTATAVVGFVAGVYVMDFAWRIEIRRIASQVRVIAETATNELPN